MTTPLDYLGAAWQKELRVRYVGDPDLAKALNRRARQQVGLMERQRKLGGTNHAHWKRVYADGAVIRTLFNGLDVIAEIDVSGMADTVLRQRRPWLPSGFVVEPASNDAPQGWGLPIIAGQGVNANDPGPKVIHWTANGPMSQVFLTRQANAGRVQQSDTQVPLYFDDFERPKGTITLADGSTRPARWTQAPEGSTWHAYRASFRSPTEQFTAILDEINSRRTGDPLNGPFVGFVDIAIETARIIGKYGGDETQYPIGAKTQTKRVEKDGQVEFENDDTARGASGLVDLSGGTTQQIVDHLVAAAPDLLSDDLKRGSSVSIQQSALALLDHGKRWIRAGNLDWVSTYAEMPRLSWFGPRGRSVPPREVSCGTATRQVGGNTTYQSVWLDDATTQTDFHGQTLKLYDRDVYARGRLLARLPNNGYVLGAGIQRLPQSDDAPLTDRLIVVGWHRADQKLTELNLPAFDGIIDNSHAGHWDTSSDIRVWYADVPRRGQLGMDPPSIIIGTYDATTNPYGWQSMGRKRITSLSTGGIHWSSTAPTNGESDYPTFDEFGAPKAYWQPWFFNGSGTSAVCLRAGFYGDTIPGVPYYFDVLCDGAVQAIRMSIEIGSTVPSYDVPWTFSNQFYDAGDRRIYAYDFVGDDARIAWFGRALGDPPGSPNFRIETTQGNALVAWSDGPRWMAFAYDARTDSGWLADFTQGTGDITNAAVFVLVHRGQFAKTFNTANPGVLVGYIGWGFTIYGYMGGAAWTLYEGHPNTLPSLAVRGSDFVAGLWNGSVPGEYAGGGAPPTTSYATQFATVQSTIDGIATLIDVEAGWLNFAGAL